MRREDLLNYIGDVDSKYVEELFEEMPVARSAPVRRYRSLRAVAASLAVVILGTVGMFLGFGRAGIDAVSIGGHSSTIGMADNSVIMLDVNPSFRFEVNDRNKVVEFDCLNGDAKKLSSEIDVIGKNYKDALKTTLEVLNRNGYVTKSKNSVLITVLDKDSNKASKIRSNAVKATDSFGKALDFTVSVLSQIMTDDTDCRELAKKYSVSSGKIAFITKICDANKDTKKLKVEMLATSSVQLLNQLITYVDAPGDVDRQGIVSGVAPKELLDELNIKDMSAEEVVKMAGDIATYDWDTPDQIIGNIQSILGAITPDE